MNSRYKRLTIGTSLLVMFSMAQIYIGASFAGSDPRPGRARVVGRNLAGTLITSGKQAIFVNGIAAVTDATVMTGSQIDSPLGVSATIDLGGLGRLDLAPSTSLKIDFSDGRIRVTLFKGCVILLTKGSTVGTVETPNGVVGGTRDASKGAGLDVCQPDGAGAPLVNQGAAANAGAGAGSGAGGSASSASAGQVAGGASGGLHPALSVFIAASLIIPMTVAAIMLNNCDHGTNPSPERNTQCL
ncbi:MAG: hypothetical protein ND895_29100 [Pyrinomonadaceae bacterium]|nr:hypothetical protein [Pyrinomonadaceae bacterium]